MKFIFVVDRKKQNSHLIEYLLNKFRVYVESGFFYFYLNFSMSFQRKLNFDYRMSLLCGADNEGVDIYEREREEWKGVQEAEAEMKNWRRKMSSKKLRLEGNKLKFPVGFKNSKDWMYIERWKKWPGRRRWFWFDFKIRLRGKHVRETLVLGNKT